MSEALGLKSRAGLRVEANQKANVYLCEDKGNCPKEKKPSGTTPYQDESLTEGEYLVKVESQEASGSAKPSWQGFVKLNGGTLSVVNRELSDSPTASSGEVITLLRGEGATVISSPSGAEVSIDGKSVGRTPVSISDLSAGEHQFLIGKENYLKRNIRATTVSGFNLTITADLALYEADLTKVPTVPLTTQSELTVKQTPTGFLRVRSTPSTTATEVTRVSPGDTLTLLEELPNWDRVRTPDGKEGYVSSAYTEKKSSQ